MKTKICYLFGHKTSKDYNDCGHLICKRCKMHEYYDYPKFYDSAVIFRPYWYLVRQLYNIKYSVKHWYRRTFKNDHLPF